VTDNAAPAMIAFRRDDMDCALEAIEDVRLTIPFNLECLVVIVPAVFALSHNTLARLAFC
jgi:hypothetical protein